MARSLVIDGEQLSRLLRVSRMLCTGSGATLRHLQKQLRTSRRTIFRILNALDGMGIKVHLGDKGYSVKQSASACKKLLADHQIKALNRLLASCLK